MSLAFDRFQLDIDTFTLLREGEPVALDPLEFDLLAYLIAHRERVVSRDELLTELWPGKVVTDGALSSRLKAVRKALGDDGRSQRFIRTVHGRGYQFVAAVPTADSSPVGALSRARTAGSVGANASSRSGDACEDSRSGERSYGSITLAGREAELAALSAALARSLERRFELVFLLGESGIGKTTLVEAFVDTACADAGVLVMTGQCLGEGDTTEPYMPLLDAMRGGARGAAEMADALARHAPTWVEQFPALLPGAQAPPANGASVSQQRLLLELADTLAAASEHQPLVLILEDLQWADPSTLTWLEFVARRSGALRLMVLATIRTRSGGTSDAPRLAAELSLRNRARRLEITALHAAALTDYLAERLGEAPDPGDVEALARYTGGQPLYARLVVDSWLAGRHSNGATALTAHLEQIPPTLTELVELAMTGLPAQAVTLLECAAVAGFEFSAPVVAAAAEADDDEVEAALLALDRQQGNPRVVGETEWPDGSCSTRFRFAHQFHAQVMYQRQPARQRQKRHEAIARRLLAAYGSTIETHAAELAEHFEKAGAREEAIRYYQYGTRYALQRGASREAGVLGRRALALLEQMPVSRERDHQEFALLIALGNALISSQGYSAAETQRVYQRARALSEELGTGPHLLPVLYGLWNNAIVSGRLGHAKTVAEQFLELARRHDPQAVTVGLRAVAWAEYLLGHFPVAQALFQQALDEALEHGTEHLVTLYGEYPEIPARAGLSGPMWFLGDLEGVRRVCQESVDRAEALGHPLSLAYALNTQMMMMLLLRDPETVRAAATRALGNAREHQIRLYEAWALGLMGWAVCEQGDRTAGIAMLRRSLDDAQALGANLHRTYFKKLLAEQLGATGELNEALTILRGMLGRLNRGESGLAEADLQRVLGELSFPVDPEAGAAAFRRAIDVARGFGTPTLTLRATLAWARAETRAGKPGPGMAALAALCPTLPENRLGLDQADALELLAPPVGAVS